MPKPILRKPRKLLKIDSDIKREKKRKRVHLDDDEESGMKMIKVDDSRFSRMSTVEKPRKRITIKTKNPSDGSSQPQLEGQPELTQGTKKRLGPLYYHKRLRERQAARDEASHMLRHDLKDDCKLHNEMLAP
ncbi:hypothetical protein PG996_002604 [Apiospora saccharicola]|uniref:Uncharacterized protein n=1 Tax=Apiospora saccharicola TaxID=335842 RepID=A0ABR1WP89_9PEZI